MLVALKATSLPTGKTPPTRLLVAPWGRNESTKGLVVVSERTAKLLPQLQRETGFDTIALDFNHNTVPGTEAYNAEKEPRKVAAHGKPVVVPGEGLYMEELAWTPEGTESFTGGHFPDVSPAVKREEDGTVVFIHSSGLVRQGAIFGLHAFSANFDPVDQLKTSMDFKSLLIQLLALKADATDAVIAAAAQKAGAVLAVFSALDAKALEAITACGATLIVVQDKVKALEAGVAAAGKETAAAVITALSADVTALKGTVATISKRAEDAERAVLIRDAIQAGKIVPLSAHNLPLEQAKTLLGELPADQVPLERRTPEGVKAFSAKLNGDDAVQAEVNRALGIKPEVYAKHNKAAA